MALAVAPRTVYHCHMLGFLASARWHAGHAASAPLYVCEPPVVSSHQDRWRHS
jgi:hypothetical protein